jgi:hypothetical protein
VVLGVLRPEGEGLAGVAKAAAVVGAAVHFGLYFGGFDPNPGVTATWGIFAAGAVTAVGAARVPRNGHAGSAAAEEVAS